MIINAPQVVPLPTAAGGLSDVSYQENTGAFTVNAALDFTNAVNGVWSLSGAPTGVTIDAVGLVTIDSDVASVQAATSIVVEYTNGSGTASSAFSMTITDAPAVWIISGSSINEAPDGPPAPTVSGSTITG